VRIFSLLKMVKRLRWSVFSGAGFSLRGFRSMYSSPRKLKPAPLVPPMGIPPISKTLEGRLAHFCKNATFIQISFR